VIAAARVGRRPAVVALVAWKAGEVLRHAGAVEADAERAAVVVAVAGRAEDRHGIEAAGRPNDESGEPRADEQAPKRVTKRERAHSASSARSAPPVAAATRPPASTTPPVTASGRPQVHIAAAPAASA